jgi:Ca-activated chloride channel family protein
MNFDQSNNFLFIIPCLVLMIFLFRRQESAFFLWVRKYWFFKRSSKNKLSTLMFKLGIVFLVIALGDLRGPEKIVKGKVAQKKTLILIDSSASMLAEDVRPNRFEKGLLLAKHYLKKAVGQQISIVVFSDKQKRIVPFTQDMNLIEARLSTLEGLDISRGGSNITQALYEAQNYFLTESGIGIGNILLITDGEENEAPLDFKLDEKLTLGVLAVGTSKGAPIPVRDSRGKLRQNKMHNGKPVITKIDDAYLKSLGGLASNYKYWITTSYTLPTEEVLSFFNSSYSKKIKKGSVRIKPVLYEYLLIPGVLLLVLSYFLKFFKTFTPALMLLLSISAYAQMPTQTPKEPEKSKETILLEEKFARNEISENEKRLLAIKLLEEGFPEQSSILYDEILSKDVDELNKLEYLNKGVSEFKTGNIKKGVETYNKLIDYLKESGQEDTELYTDVKKNILKALQTQQNQQGKGESDQEQENNQNDQSGEGQSEQNQDNQDGQQDQQDQDGQQKNQGNNQKDKGDQKKKDQQNKEGNQDKKDKKDNKGEGENQKNKDKKKIPALLKQLMSDDNQLQKKMIDAETRERRKRDKKDW